ncbi:unnamed protein product [Microthlaspi erraticum]|uniref:MATH domain-containing protein n=1 Tax=Microthlaspi erraticum TaxID=1685480 RepID=A0A6D2IS62_9BRAS|nr:unnamed protein product [Microthlaspi erraticum]
MSLEHSIYKQTRERLCRNQRLLTNSVFLETHRFVSANRFNSTGNNQLSQFQSDCKTEIFLKLNHTSFSYNTFKQHSFVLDEQLKCFINLFPLESPRKLFCAEIGGWGRTRAVPLQKLQKYMVKNKLIVKVEVKVVEVVDEGVVTGKEMLDVRGFQVLYHQVVSVGRLFIEHPDIALNLRLTNQFLKTTYMNVLLGLVETLNKPPHDISETELSNAGSELIDLTDVGFKLDWLKTKLDEVTLERKKSNVQVQELEEHIKNLTLDLNKEKGKADTCAAKVLSLEKTVSDLEYELNKEKLESAAKILSLEQTVSTLKHKEFDLEKELQKEKNESYTYAAKANSLEQTMWDLKYKVFDLKEELNKEKQESY